MAIEQVQKRMQMEAERAAKQQKEFELELRLLGLLPEDSPECKVYPYELYGRVATLKFNQADLDWALGFFTPVEILKTGYGSTFTSFLPSITEHLEKYEKKSKVSSWESIGNYILKLGFIEACHVVTGKIQWFSFLGDYLIEINVELASPTDYIMYTKVEHAESPEYRSKFSDRIKAGYQYASFWASVKGCGDKVVYRSDCNELTDLIELP